MNKITCCLAALALSTTAFGAPSPSSLEKQASITMSQARTIALNTYQGKIVSEELEQEKGGSGLRYSFDIGRGKVVHEVGVDAKTGKVLENSIDHD